MSKKVSLLFLCTGNSCRSQMAEGLCRHLKNAEIDCASAGIETHGLNPNAVRVMAEIGIDISGHKSQTVADFADREFDYVITVCNHAHETCPYFPARTAIVHHGFDDPPRLAADAATEEQALAHYRRVRDEIQQYVVSLPASLPGRFFGNLPS